MIVKIAKNAGFCGGVKNALDMALKLAESGKLYTVGDLVHNELVTDFLHSKGIFSISIEDARNLSEGDRVLIRAHGIPKEDEQFMRNKGICIYDATCPVVKKIHKIVAERRLNGEDIIIIGDKTHDEVTGTASYADGHVEIFSEKEQVNIPSDKHVSIVFQTTILADKFEEVKLICENYKKNNGNLVGIFNTICYTTRARQDEARELALTSDAVLTLGSRTSANTLRLYQVAKELNENTFFAEIAIEAAQIKEKIKNRNIHCLSIVAGASTPPWLIQEVTQLMSETQETTVETTATEIEANKEATLQEQTQTADVKEKELTMEDVLASKHSVGYTNYKVGKRVKGSVISADETGIFIAIGGKKDGFIDKSEATIDGNYSATDYASGDQLEAVITSVTKEYVSLSKKEVDVLRAEEAEAEKALSAGEFKLKMTEVVKGGLRGRLGSYTVFVPASQIKIGYVKNLEDYKDKELRLTLMPPKEKELPESETVTDAAVEPVADDKPAKKSKYLFASQRLLLEKERKEKEDSFWNNIHVHDVVTGKVKRFTAFGAFVSVRGFDCLAHISELSWNKINDPATVLTIGESYDFVVLKMDRDTGKISLGFKQLQKKPYEVAAESYPVGTIIKGKVERIFPYGAFISITEGVDGLVHVSQISHNWIKDASEALKVGEEVEAKIIGFEENRITLSIKELLPVPEGQDMIGAINEAADGTDSEEKPKRTSRLKKFEQKLADGEGKRERHTKRESSSEPKEWVTGNSAATLGDLFKNLKLDLNEKEEDTTDSE